MKMESDNKAGHVFQINISSAGGVPKQAVRQADITAFGVAGDSHAHPDIHGGSDKAVCLYSLERILDLQSDGHPIYPGSAGENLTLSGIDWAGIVPGTRLRLGEQVLIEVNHYTTPCNSIAASFKGKDYSRISQSRFPGWSRVYARVLQPGLLSVGDGVWMIK